MRNYSSQHPHPPFLLYRQLQRGHRLLHFRILIPVLALLSLVGGGRRRREIPSRLLNYAFSLISLFVFPVPNLPLMIGALTLFEVFVGGWFGSVNQFASSSRWRGTLETSSNFSYWGIPSAELRCARASVISQKPSSPTTT